MASTLASMRACIRSISFEQEPAWAADSNAQSAAVLHVINPGSAAKVESKVRRLITGKGSAILVPCHALNTDTGNLALVVETEQKARRIAAWEYEFHQVECLVLYRALFHDFGAQR